MLEWNAECSTEAWQKEGKSRKADGVQSAGCEQLSLLARLE